MPSAFPHGLPHFHEQLRLPIVAHNRWWSAEVDYASQNGGSYGFITEPHTSTWAVPTEQRFWDDLFFNASAWGLRVYQQDWLYNEFETVTALTRQVDLARQWLLQMGQGAADAGVSIMYCMPSPRHVLQSIEIPNVRQVRASDDYIPGNEAWHNWMVHLTSLLEWSLGLAPSKDDFWTTEYQPGSIYRGGHEPDPQLQSLVATLATGQVTPSDGIGYFSSEVIMRSVRADGLILKPDRPALHLDFSYVDSAFGSDQPRDYTVGTYSMHGTRAWTYVLTVNAQEVGGRGQQRPVRTVADMMPPHIRRVALKGEGSHLLVSVTPDHPYPSNPTRVSLDSELPHLLGAWALLTLSLTVQVPGVPVEVGLIGEGLKWLFMSAQRVRGGAGGRRGGGRVAGGRGRRGGVDVVHLDQHQRGGRGGCGGCEGGVRPHHLWGV